MATDRDRQIREPTDPAAWKYPLWGMVNGAMVPLTQNTIRADADSGGAEQFYYDPSGAEYAGQIYYQGGAPGMLSPEQWQTYHPDWFSSLMEGRAPLQYNPDQYFQYPSYLQDQYRVFQSQQDDIWDTLGDMGPLIALGGLAAGPFATSLGLYGGGGALGAASPPESYWRMLADAGTMSDAAPAGAGALGEGSAAGAEFGTFGSMPTGSYGWESFMPGGNLTSSFYNPGVGGAVENLAASGVGAASAWSGSTSPLVRILTGEGKLDDYLKVGGEIAPSVLGYLGASRQAGLNQDMMNQYFGLGAPYRSLLQASYQPGFSLLNEPGYKQALETAQDQFLRAASAGRAQGVSRGNPLDADNPGAWQETMKHVIGSTALPYLTNYRSGLASAGQLGIGPSMPFAQGQIAGQAGQYNALGYGLGQLLNPTPDYNQQIMDLLRQRNEIEARKSGYVLA